MMENRITAEDLKYPKLKADLDRCHKFLSELCQIVWNRNYHTTMPMWSIPHETTDFDMQIDAALHEVEAFRATNLTPAEITELARAKEEGRIAPTLCRDCIYHGEIPCPESDDYTADSWYCNCGVKRDYPIEAAEAEKERLEHGQT